MVVEFRLCIHRVSLALVVSAKMSYSARSRFGCRIARPQQNRALSECGNRIQEQVILPEANLVPWPC